MLADWIVQLPGDDFNRLCIFSALAALAGFVFGFIGLYRKRLLEDMPTARIRAAHQGYVELEGVAKLMEGPPIIAPLSRTRCAWWRYSIAEKSRSGRSSKWSTIAKGRSSGLFLLEDETGTCIVDPDHAKVIPSDVHTWYGNSKSPDRGPAAGGGLMFSQYRYREELLSVGKPLYAIGGFRTQTSADSFDEQADLRDLLSKWKNDKKMMELFDVNKDGNVDMREWEAARRMALKKIRDEHVRQSVDTPDLNILSRPRDRRPYILSGKTQAQLVRDHTLQAVGGLAGCGMGLVLFLYALMVRGIL